MDGECRLSDPGRPIENQRAKPVLLDRSAQRRAFPEDVLLADELCQRSRTQSHSEWRVLSGAFPCGICEEVAH